MTEPTHALAGDLSVRVTPDATGFDTALASKLTAAERVAQISGEKMSASLSKVQIDQLRVAAATEKSNRLFQDSTVTVEKLAGAEATRAAAVRRLAADEAKAAQPSTLLGRLFGGSQTGQRVLGAAGATGVPGAGLLSRVSGIAGLGGAAGAEAGVGGAALGGLAAVAGGVAAAVGLEEVSRRSINTFVEEALAVRHLQQATGASAGDASRLTDIFGRFNISADQGATAVLRLGRNITDQPDKFRKLGVEVAYNHDGTVNLYKSLLNLNTAFHNTPDAATRAAIVMGLVGRGGAALLPVLAASTEQLKAFNDEAAAHHEIFTQAEINQAYAYSVATTNMHHSVRGLEIELGEKLAPVLTTVVNDITDAVGIFDTVAHAVGTAEHAVNSLTDHLPAPLRYLSEFGRAISNPVSALSAVTHLFGHHASSAQKAADAQDALAASQQAVADTAAGVSDAINEAFASTKPSDPVKLAASAKTASDELTKANIRLHEAELVLARDRQNTGAPSALAVMRAEDTLFSARERLAKLEQSSKATSGERELAARKVHEAELALAQLESGQGASAARKLAADEDKLKVAQLNSAAAARKAHDDQTKLAHARTSTVLSTADVLKSLTGEESTLSQRLTDIQKLHAEGLSDAAAAALLQIDQKNAGTLHDVAAHAGAKWIVAFNAGIEATGQESAALKRILAPEFDQAGDEWGKIAAASMHTSFVQELNLLFGKSVPTAPTPRPGGGDFVGGTRHAIIINGPVTVATTSKITSPVTTRATKLSTGALTGIM